MPHLLIVEARFYAELADALLDGRVCTGVPRGRDRGPTPRRAESRASSACRRRYDGFVALGTLIRRSIISTSARRVRALMALTLDGLAIGNGFLTVETSARVGASARSEKDNGGEPGRPLRWSRCANASAELAEVEAAGRGDARHRIDAHTSWAVR